MIPLHVTTIIINKLLQNKRQQQQWKLLFGVVFSMSWLWVEEKEKGEWSRGGHCSSPSRADKWPGILRGRDSTPRKVVSGAPDFPPAGHQTNLLCRGFAKHPSPPPQKETEFHPPPLPPATFSLSLVSHPSPYIFLFGNKSPTWRMWTVCYDFHLVSSRTTLNSGRQPGANKKRKKTLLSIFSLCRFAWMIYFENKTFQKKKNVADIENSKGMGEGRRYLLFSIFVPGHLTVVVYSLTIQWLYFAAQTLVMSQSTKVWVLAARYILHKLSLMRNVIFLLITIFLKKSRFFDYYYYWPGH